MIKRILALTVFGAAAMTNTGCKNEGGMKKVKGIEFKIIKDAPGPTAKVGDIIEMNFVAKMDTMVLADSRKQGNGMPFVRRVDSITHSGQFETIFPYLSVGDSAIEYISCDTIISTIPPQQRGQLPPWMKKGNKIFITIAVTGIKSMDEYRKEMEAQQQKMMQEMKEKEDAQKPIDDKMLADYMAKNNIKAQKTEDGLYYTIEKPGSGPQIEKGEIVSMMYTGKTLEGKAFDSNIDTTIGHHGSNPLNFSVGMHQMIPGVDEGVALLKKGAKATLYLPSRLGYGAQGNNGIAPNSVLVFDVIITDVKPAPKPTAGKPGMPMQAAPQHQ